MVDEPQPRADTEPASPPSDVVVRPPLPDPDGPALIREVAAEGCARVVRCQYLACQHVADPLNPDGVPSYYQTRWWARVELDPWQPQHEMTERRLVPPDQVLATLFGHTRSPLTGYCTSRWTPTDTTGPGEWKSPLLFRRWRGEVSVRRGAPAGGVRISLAVVRSPRSVVKSP